MRRVIRRTALGLAVLLALLVGGILITARPGDPSLYPSAAGQAGQTIFIVNHGYHTGIVLPRDATAAIASRRGHAALIAVTTRFQAYRWIEAGWGDEGFYRTVPTAASLTVGVALRALFMPGNSSVLHIVGLNDTPAAIFGSSNVVPLTLSGAGFERMVDLLDKTFARGPDGTIGDDLGGGLYGPSLFYRAVGNFHLLRVCNHWVANMLDAAGVPTTYLLATAPSGLLLDLRWRSGIVPAPRP